MPGFLLNLIFFKRYCYWMLIFEIYVFCFSISNISRNIIYFRFLVYYLSRKKKKEVNLGYTKHSHTKNEKGDPPIV